MPFIKRLLVLSGVALLLASPLVFLGTSAANAEEVRIQVIRRDGSPAANVAFSVRKFVVDDRKALDTQELARVQTNDSGLLLFGLPAQYEVIAGGISARTRFYVLQRVGAVVSSTSLPRYHLIQIAEGTGCRGTIIID